MNPIIIALFDQKYYNPPHSILFPLLKICFPKLCIDEVKFYVPFRGINPLFLCGGSPVIKSFAVPSPPPPPLRYGFPLLLPFQNAIPPPGLAPPLGRSFSPLNPAVLSLTPVRTPPLSLSFFAALIVFLISFVSLFWVGGPCVQLVFCVLHVPLRSLPPSAPVVECGGSNFVPPPYLLFFPLSFVFLPS